MKYTLIKAACMAAVTLGMFGCGGPELDTASTSQSLNSNCTELCRRYVSMDIYGYGPVVGRPVFGNPQSGAAIAADYLTQASGLPVHQRGSRCSQGNVAVSSQWNTIQPHFDIYRDRPSQSSALIAQCASDFGL